MSVYKATLRYTVNATPALQVFDKTPELNVVATVSTENQIVLTHPSIKEATPDQAGSVSTISLCEVFDNETTPSLKCSNGQASLQVLGDRLVHNEDGTYSLVRTACGDFEVCVSIEF